MKIGEFFISLGVKSDNKTLKDFTRSIGDMSTEAATGIISLIGLQYKLTQLAGEAMNAAVGFEMFKAQTGLSWQELQRWQLVAQQAHVSAEAVTASVTGLQKQMAEIRLGRGNFAPFQMLGIGVNGNAFEVLDQIRQRIKGMDRTTATNIIEQMGLTPDMIAVLQLSNQEFEKLSHTVRGMTDQQEQGFVRAKDAMIQWGLAFKYEGFDIVSHFIALFEKLNTMIPELTHGMLKFRDILIALAIYFAPVTAAVVALLLVLDDLAVYFTGGNSITGLAIEGLKKFGKELKAAFTLPQIGSMLPNAVTAATGGLVNGPNMMALAGNKNLQNIFNISVTGAGPAEAIAAEVTRQISKHFGQSEQELNNQGH